MSEQHKIKASAKRMEMAPETVTVPGARYEVPPAVVLVEQDGTPIDAMPVYITSVSNERLWHLMDNAPQDGTMIEVKEDPEDPDVSAVMVRYYHTSVRDRARRKWVPAAWWRNALTAERLSFEPFCWRMPDGFTQPGMIVA
jgi:hypothetical protein